MRAVMLILLTFGMFLPQLADAQPVAWSINSDSSGSGGEPAPWQLLNLNLDNASATLVGDTGYIDVEGLASAPDGRLYGIDDATKTLIIINTSDGSAASVNGSLGNIALNDPQDPAIAFDCAGQLWMATRGTESLYRVDPSNGDLTLVGNMGTPMTALTATQQGLFGLGPQNAEGFYSIDSDSGSASRLGSLDLGHGYSGAGLSVDQNGQFWAVFDRSNPSAESTVVARIDAQSGQATQVGTTVMGLESLALPYSQQCATAGGTARSVPTLGWPALLLLMLSLIAGAGFAVKRR
jgi:hypothetical protein